MDHQRYSRQILFSGIGEEGQEKLLNSKVLIVGMGALGTVLANHMVRAGVGHVRFIDRDYVEESNLQRQMLFDEQDVEQRLPKAVAAERKLNQINSEINVQSIVSDITAANIDQYADDVDLILDGTDNFQTRFLLNDYAFNKGIPFIYGGAVSSRGMQAAFNPNLKTPCLRCLFDEAGGSNETCDTSGVIAPVVDMVASYQAVDAIKLLTGNEREVRNSLLSFDIWHDHRYEMKWTSSKEGCLTCDQKVYPSLEVSNEDQVTTLCGRETVQITPQDKKKRDLDDWADRLSKIGEVEKTPFLLRFHIDQLTMVLFSDGRVLIQGTEDPATAKSAFARYIGM